ncbi:MAG: Crp/Fnr family transcriptional regulator [Candidatus Cybelea sp.]|jgi:CRP/FNR family transcriptional regulator
MQNDRERMNETPLPSYRKGEFFKALSTAALADLEPLLAPSTYPSNMVLFNETQPTDGIYVVLDGEVKLSINSSDGRRLAFHIAKAGEVLGLSATLSGGEYEMTADTSYPSKIAHIERQTFMQFLARHLDVYPIVTREIGRSFNLACDQLRMVGLSTSVHERLARLLLVWSDGSEKKSESARCRLSMTHEEIGEFIGASRETVTRTLSIFKNRHLVAQHGCTITIPSRNALENYARG